DLSGTSAAYAHGHESSIKFQTPLGQIPCVLVSSNFDQAFGT
ncbi:3710_t:CDS:1, partial [Dentiscutata heterogama]